MDGSYDEVFSVPGAPREHARALAAALAELGPTALADAGRMRDSIFMQEGITFDAAGPDADGPVRDRPFPLDLVPRIIPGEEWRRIKRGLAQRIRALNAFVDDVYHGREIVHEGIVPWQLIVSRSAFARAAHGIRPPATYVGSTVEDLLDAGAGVCQDFAHLALPLLRRHGLAARYVSGYLFAPDGDSSDSAEVDTHAWVKALLRTGDGAEPAWVAADPTNRGLARERHVKMAT